MTKRTYPWVAALLVSILFGCSNIPPWGDAVLYRETRVASEIVVVRADAEDVQNRVVKVGYQKIDDFGERPVALVGAWPGFSEDEILKHLGDVKMKRAADNPDLSGYEKIHDPEKGSRSVMLVFKRGDKFIAVEYSVSR